MRTVLEPPLCNAITLERLRLHDDYLAPTLNEVSPFCSQHYPGDVAARLWAPTGFNLSADTSLCIPYRVYQVFTALVSSAKRSILYASACTTLNESIGAI